MTTPSSRTFSRSIPESDFAVVKDTERGHIVASGTYSDMLAQADTFNSIYQSTAYRAEKWESNRIY